MNLTKFGKYLKDNHYEDDFDGLSDREIGEMVREEYEDFTDSEFTEAIHERFPDFGSTDLTAPQSRQLQVKMPVINQLDRATKENIEFLRDKLQPQNGWFKTWRTEVHSKRNQRLIKALSENELAVIEHGVLLEKAARRNQVELTNFHLFLKTNQHVLVSLCQMLWK